MRITRKSLVFCGTSNSRRAIARKTMMYNIGRAGRSSCPSMLTEQLVIVAGTKNTSRGIGIKAPIGQREDTIKQTTSSNKLVASRGLLNRRCPVIVHARPGFITGRPGAIDRPSQHGYDGDTANLAAHRQLTSWSKHRDHIDEAAIGHRAAIRTTSPKCCCDDCLTAACAGGDWRDAPSAAGILMRARLVLALTKCAKIACRTSIDVIARYSSAIICFDN